MTFVKQTLNAVGMLTIAAGMLLVFRGVQAGVFPWVRLLGVIVFAGLPFWAAARVRRGED